MANREGSDKWIRLIGLVKSLKGVLLLALAVGGLKLLHKNVAEQVTNWIQGLNMDPNNHLFQKLMEKLHFLDSRKLLLYTCGTVVYAALFLTEGIGLLFLKHWAEYFAVIITASFLPFEGYELFKKFSVFKLLVMAVNAAIVVYLIVRLKGKSRKTG